MATTCPGAEHASRCDNHACRRHGCQGGPPKPAAAATAAHHDHGAAEAARHGVERSSRWPSVERAFRAAHPHCLACPPGAPAHAVQVHHVNPFHYVVALGRPDLELDSRNLVSLCETEEGRPAANHHLLIGHLGNFKEGNLAVVQDATVTFHGMSDDAIRADKRWLAEEKAGRLKPLDAMTEAEKRAFRERLDRDYPIIAAKAAA